MTIHRVEYFFSFSDAPYTAVAYCGAEEPLASPTMTQGSEANCTACAEKMEATRRAEWAAVRP